MLREFSSVSDSSFSLAASAFKGVNKSENVLVLACLQDLALFRSKVWLAYVDA